MTFNLGGCGSLEINDFGYLSLGGCGGIERPDFCQFSPWEYRVDLNAQILNNFHFGNM